MDLHIATCTKYLEELSEIDLVEERKRQGKTRVVSQYRVKDPKIRLEFKLDNIQLDSEAFEFYDRLYSSLLERTENVYGSVPLDDRTKDKNNISEDVLDEILSDIRRLLEYNERTLGLPLTKKLVKRAGDGVIEQYKDIMEKDALLDALPPKYFDLLKEECM